MKTLLVILALAAAALFLTPYPKGRCAWCYSGQCLNSSICGGGCVCVKQGMDSWGYCASFNRK